MKIKHKLTHLETINTLCKVTSTELKFTSLFEYNSEYNWMDWEDEVDLPFICLVLSKVKRDLEYYKIFYKNKIYYMDSHHLYDLESLE